MGKDSDAVFGIILGVLGLAAILKASEKTCPYCFKKIIRGYITMSIL